MNTRYFCAMCNTKPDQISHHKSHLQTQKHREKREAYARELGYFSVYKTIHPNNWLQHDEIKEIIRCEFGIELTLENRHDILIQKMDIIDKYCKWEPNKVFCDIVNGKPTHEFVEPSEIYKKELGLHHYDDKSAYLEWCIERIVQSKETIKATHKTSNPDARDTRRAENMQRMQLSRCTNVDYKVLQDIRMNKLDIQYVKHPSSFVQNWATCVDKPNFLNDTIVRYACILLNAFSMPKHYIWSPGADDTIDEYLYFYKEVEIQTKTHMFEVAGYEKMSVVNKKVWVKTSSLNEDEDGFHPEFIYVEDEVIKQKFRDYLIQFFTERKERFLWHMNREYVQDITPKDEEDHNYLRNCKKKLEMCKAYVKSDFPEVEKDFEIVSKLLIDSEIFRNVMKLCEFFFEYKYEIISQYFCGCDFDENEEAGEENFNIKGLIKEGDVFSPNF